MPNINTCTPAELRDLFVSGGQPDDAHYLIVHHDGTMELQPLEAGQTLGSDSARKFWWHIPGDDDMTNSPEDATSDDTMKMWIAEGQGFWRDNKLGAVN